MNPDLLQKLSTAATIFAKETMVSRASLEELQDASQVVRAGQDANLIGAQLRRRRERNTSPTKSTGGTNIGCSQCQKVAVEDEQEKMLTFGGKVTTNKKNAIMYVHALCTTCDELVHKFLAIFNWEIGAYIATGVLPKTHWSPEEVNALREIRSRGSKVEWTSAVGVWNIAAPCPSNDAIRWTKAVKDTDFGASADNGRYRLSIPLGRKTTLNYTSSTKTHFYLLASAPHGWLWGGSYGADALKRECNYLVTCDIPPLVPLWTMVFDKIAESLTRLLGKRWGIEGRAATIVRATQDTERSSINNRMRELLMKNESQDRVKMEEQRNESSRKTDKSSSRKRPAQTALKDRGRKQSISQCKRKQIESMFEVQAIESSDQCSVVEKVPRKKLAQSREQKSNSRQITKIRRSSDSYDVIEKVPRERIAEVKQPSREEPKQFKNLRKTPQKSEESEQEEQSEDESENVADLIASEDQIAQEEDEALVKEMLEVSTHSPIQKRLFETRRSLESALEKNAEGLGYSKFMDIWYKVSKEQEEAGGSLEIIPHLDVISKMVEKEGGWNRFSAMIDRMESVSLIKGLIIQLCKVMFGEDYLKKPLNQLDAASSLSRIMLEMMPSKIAYAANGQLHQYWVNLWMQEWDAEEFDKVWKSCNTCIRHPLKLWKMGGGDKKAIIKLAGGIGSQWIFGNKGIFGPMSTKESDIKYKGEKLEPRQVTPSKDKPLETPLAFSKLLNKEKSDKDIKEEHSKKSKQDNSEELD